MRIVEPVDVVDEFMGLCTKTDWFDVQVIKACVLRIDDKVLRLDGHELWIEPGAE